MVAIVIIMARPWRPDVVLLLYYYANIHQTDIKNFMSSGIFLLLFIGGVLVENPEQTVLHVSAQSVISAMVMHALL